MKIEMRIKIQGSRNGVRWPNVGGVVDLPDNEAGELIDQGFAVRVTPVKAAVAKVEKAVAKKPEKRRG